MSFGVLKLKVKKYESNVVAVLANVLVAASQLVVELGRFVLNKLK